jgi:hypothetical protein
LVSDVIGASKCYVDHFNAWLFGASYPTAEASPNQQRAFADAKFPEMDRDRSGAVSYDDALGFFRALQLERGSPGGLIVDSPELDAESFILAHHTK